MSKAEIEIENYGKITVKLEREKAPITVDNLTEFKDAVKDGYKQIILTKTLDIEGKQTISAKNLAIVTTPEKITMFNIGKEGSLTLENIVLDGQNEYKVNFNGYNPYSSSDEDIAYKIEKIEPNY